MSKVCLKTICWPVGQGLFTSIHLCQDKQTFSIVYDCGVKQNQSPDSKIDNQIDCFYNECHNKKLDLLVISHFHEDHISHISTLLKKTNGAVTAMIPYISAKQKYLYKVRLAYSKANGNITDTMVGNIWQIIDDPVAYLRDLNVERVIRLGGEENPDTSITESEGETFRLGNITQTSGDATFKSYTANILSVNPVLELLTWIKQPEQSKLEEFYGKIAKILNTSPGDNNISCEQLVDIMKDTKNIRYIYKQLNSNLNDTSLCMMINRISPYTLCKCYSGVPYVYRICSAGPSIFMCGDIERASIKELVSKDHLISLKNTCIWQIPHHGANSSWDQYLWDVISPADSFISCGMENKYHHPCVKSVANTTATIVTEYSEPYKILCLWNI